MNKIKICVALFTLISILALYACLDRNSNPNIEDLESYNYSSSLNQTTEEPESLAISSEWQSNYKLTYRYMKDTEESIITEYRGEDFFCSVDNETGIITYLQQADDDIKQYMLNPSTLVGSNIPLLNQNLSHLRSGFMKIATVNPYFISYNNVTFNAEDKVSERQAKKYIQKAYKENQLTSLAYVWIDDEYGFASKCEVFSDSGTLIASWELLEIEVGNISLASIDENINLSQYSIEEDLLEITTE